MAVVAGLIRARKNKTDPPLPAARALPARVVADLLYAERWTAGSATVTAAPMQGRLGHMLAGTGPRDRYRVKALVAVGVAS
jgi:hypothetical protein